MKKSTKISDSSIDENKSIEISELTKNTIIIILSILIALLLTFIIFSRLIYEKNIEALTVISTTELEHLETSTDNQLKININSDNRFELMELPGIGENKADAIIEYRKENGDFSSIDEIKNVSGIGESIFIKIRDYIYVG